MGNLPSNIEAVDPESAVKSDTLFIGQCIQIWIKGHCSAYLGGGLFITAHS